VLLSACSSDKSKDLEQETKDRVDRAVTLVEEKGSAAFPEFSEPEWAHDEHYVFIIDMDGTSLVHPVSPDLVGTDISDLHTTNLNIKDARGCADLCSSGAASSHRTSGVTPTLGNP